MNLEFTETKCCTCGKELCILNASKWVYKMQRSGHGKIYFYCGWNCLQASRETRAKNASGDVVKKMLKEGKDTHEIVEKTGLTASAVRYWKSKLK